MATASSLYSKATAVGISSDAGPGAADAGDRAVRGANFFRPKPDLHRRSPSSLLTAALSKNQTVNGAAVEGYAGARVSDKTESATDADDPPSEHLGFATNLEELYEFGETLGKGGNGLVRLVTHRNTGATFACKTIPKVLEADAAASDHKVANHLESVKTEIEVMRRLQGTLNVARLDQVFEDNTHVHIVMEHCRGGELLHTLGQKHYSEQTVASVMRAVLRTLAQCHSHRILHLDIKPGNFMLLDSSDIAPLKAIDFGLSKPFDPESLPLTNLGLEGTPWFMAPEMLSSSVTPACDIWAAGVMVFQLLTGYFPFDDRRNPMKPSVNAIWRSILVDEINWKRSYWDGISDEAKDFIKCLLNKDPKKRPTAKEALEHPWLQSGTVEDRFSTKPKGLRSEVVQRIQRFGQHSLVKRTLLESLVTEMLESGIHHPPESCPTSPYTVTTPECNLALGALVKHLAKAGDGHAVTYHTMQKLLIKMGYNLYPEEVEQLMRVMDTGNQGKVAVSQFVASQMDWSAVQKHHTRCFEAAAVRSFNNLDIDGDGKISTEELNNMLASHLPSSDLQPAIEDTRHIVESKGLASSSGNLNFTSFLEMLRCGSQDSISELNQYDDKLSSCASSASLEGLLAEMEKSLKGGTLHGSNEWEKLEKTVKDNNLQDTPEWKEIEKSVNGGGWLADVFGKSVSSHSSEVF